MTNEDSLLSDLKRIGEMRRILPMNWRGLVDHLGLFVDLRVSQWFGGDKDLTGTMEYGRLSAGGRYRKVLNATLTSSGWTIEKLDGDVWQNRFAGLVGPALLVLEYQHDLVMRKGQVDNDFGLLEKAVEQFERTGEWKDESLRRRLQERRKLPMDW